MANNSIFREVARPLPDRPLTLFILFATRYVYKELKIYFEKHFRICMLGVQKFDRIIQVSRILIFTVVARADTSATFKSGTDKISHIP